MFFINDDHEQNYHELMTAFGRKPGEDPEYEVTIYIAAVPEIRKLIPRDALDRTLRKSITPLLALAEWNERESRWMFNHEGLTGATSQMAMYGMSLYNSQKISLADVFGTATSTENFKVLQQAILIYTRREATGQKVH